MLRIERDAWSMVKRLRQATNEYAPPRPLRAPAPLPLPPSQGTKQSGIHLHRPGRLFEEPYITATDPPKHDDHGSRHSGSTFKDKSFQSMRKEFGSNFEGTRREGQEYVQPPADAAPGPTPVQQVHPGTYLVGVCGMYYPTGGSPPPLHQEANSQPTAPEENVAAEHPIPMDYEHQQVSNHGENDAEVCYPSPPDQCTHPQGLECEDNFSSMCPTPTRMEQSMPRCGDPPSAYGEIAYYSRIP